MTRGRQATQARQARPSERGASDALTLNTDTDTFVTVQDMHACHIDTGKCWPETTKKNEKKLLEQTKKIKKWLAGKGMVQGCV